MAAIADVVSHLQTTDLERREQRVKHGDEIALDVRPAVDIASGHFPHSTVIPVMQRGSCRRFAGKVNQIDAALRTAVVWGI
jgi:hypothetical protein